MPTAPSRSKRFSPVGRRWAWLVACWCPLWLTGATTASTGLFFDLATGGAGVVAVGDNGRISLSSDQGATWRALISPVRANLTAVTFATPNLGWAVGHDATIVATRDGGLTWAVQFASSPGQEQLSRDTFPEQLLLDVCFLDSTRGFAVGAYGLLLQTSDAGTTWAQQEAPGGDVHLNAIRERPGGGLYLVGESGLAWLSLDAGTTWEEMETPYDGSWFGVAVPGGPTLALWGLRGHFFTSQDVGVSWVQAEGLGEAAVLAALPLGGGLWAAADAAGRWYLSTDEAQTFALWEVRHRTGGGLAAVLAEDRRSLIVAAERGLFALPLPSGTVP